MGPVAVRKDAMRLFDWNDRVLEMGEVDWKETLKEAIALLVRHPVVSASISEDHTVDTPVRFVKAFQEYFSGLEEDPEEVLRKGFESGSYDQMITLSDIEIASVCAHHLTPILGFVHFGYLPAHKGKIVGLSKIPRMIQVYSRRPQVQEKLTQEISNCFNKIVKPKGCGVVIDAVHLCMAIRGARSGRVFTRTSALCGAFRDSDTVKAEFFSSIPPVGSHSWT